MNIRKVVPLVSLSLAAALVAHWTTARALANPFGTSYLLTVDNAPRDGTGEIQFGGRRFETVPGTGLRVKEHVSDVHGKKLVEFWFRTWRDKSFVSLQEDIKAPASISIQGLEWNDSSTVPWVKPDSAFLYFTHDGEPQPMWDKYDLGFDFGRHPKHRSIQVLWLNNPAWSLSDITLSTEQLGVPSLLKGLYALGLKPWKINDLHFGFKIHTPKIPEPSSLLLAAVGGGLLLAVSRRRRRSQL